MGTPWPQDNFFFSQDDHSSAAVAAANANNSNNNNNPQQSNQQSTAERYDAAAAAAAVAAAAAQAHSYHTASSIPIAVAQPPLYPGAPPDFGHPPPPSHVSSGRFGAAGATNPAAGSSSYPFAAFSGGAMQPALPPLPAYSMAPRRAPASLVPGVRGGISKSNALSDLATSPRASQLPLPPTSSHLAPPSSSTNTVTIVHDDDDDWQPDTRVGKARVMTRCPQCGHENHIRRKICQACQAPKPPPAKRKRRRRRRKRVTNIGRYDHTQVAGAMQFPSAVALQPLAGHSLLPPPAYGGGVAPAPLVHDPSIISALDVPRARQPSSVIVTATAGGSVGGSGIVSTPTPTSSGVVGSGLATTPASTS